MQRIFLSLGSFFALVSVAAGAFGAHLLAKVLSPGNLEIFQTAARYQMYHALALLLVALLSLSIPSKLLTAAGWCFVVGIILFCGSLYALSLTDIKILGAITPLGGLGLMTGWGLLAATGWSKK